MPVPITALYAIPLTLIVSYLASRAGRMRGKTGISIMWGDDMALALEMRRHANFVEFVPWAMLLMAIAELNGAPGTVLHIGGSLLVLARILHPIGLNQESVTSPLRGIGAGGTLLATLILLGAVIYTLV